MNDDHTTDDMLDQLMAVVQMPKELTPEQARVLAHRARELYEEGRQEKLKAQKAKARQTVSDKARRGEPTGCVPIGYLKRIEGGQMWLEIDPVKGPLVAEAFRLAAEGHSLRTVRARMLELGLTGTRGKPITLSSLQYMLRNKFYEETFKGARAGVKQLIKRRTFAKAQARLWNNRCA
jgi:hypothetical protein